jgi:DNA-directed RNA polymerase specialized sigma24 family protein
VEAVLRHLRRLAAAEEFRRQPDRELLQRFTQSQDEAAFAALVERHGPMVLRVCRRILRSEADAEDAFQATFLVLVRKARSIHRGDSVRSWLYGVAYRVACKAKQRSAE